MDHLPEPVSNFISDFTELLLHTDNRFLIAAIDTITVSLILILFGLIIGGITNALTSLLSRLIGFKAAFFLRNYLTYPGTVHHELSHALIATVTGAKVKRITLVPRGRELGSATFLPAGNRLMKSLQLTLTSIAPVLCGGITLSLLWIYVRPLCASNWQLALLWYLMISILLHMNLSSKDIQVAKKGLPVCLLILYLIFCLWNIPLLAFLVQKVLLLI